nr:hypothetical protein pmam_272 [Pithovirus mammoth]
MAKLEETFCQLREFRNDRKQKYIIVREETKEGRRQIHSWASINRFEARNECKSYRDRVKSVECDHCGHVEDYTDPNCICGCDEYDSYFTCSDCYETTYWDSDTCETVKWTKKKVPTGNIIVVRELPDNYDKLTPTAGAKWENPYM